MPAVSAAVSAGINLDLKQAVIIFPTLPSDTPTAPLQLQLLTALENDSFGKKLILLNGVKFYNRGAESRTGFTDLVSSFPNL